MERMKKTSNKLFDYHGHIDCRNLSSDLDELEMGLSITSMQQQSNLLGHPSAAPQQGNRRNRFMHIGYLLVKKICD